MVFHVFRLIRLSNLLIIVLTMVLIRYGLVQPILHIYHIPLVFPLTNFMLLVSAVVLIAAAGYVINDYFDVEADTINRPDELVIGKFIMPATAKYLYYVLNATALLLAFFVCSKNESFSLFFIFPVTIGILWFYTTTYKRQLLIGNVLVSVITAVVPLLVPVFDIPPVYKSYHAFFLSTHQDLNIIFIWTAVFAVFAFLLNLTRELVKDAEDFEGDVIHGRNTMPAAAGINVTKASCIFLLVAVIAILAYFYFHYLSVATVETNVNGKTEYVKHPDVITAVYFTLFLLIPMLAAIFLTSKAKEKKHYTLLTILLKGIMVAGILYTLVVRFKLL